MMKITSFRWSRLATVSAWERLWRRLELFLFGFVFVGIVSIWWWNNCWMFGIPVLLIGIILLVCTADDFCKIGNNSYYFYKIDFGYQMEVHDYSGWQTIDILSWEYEKVSEQEFALLYCDTDNCWNIVSRQICIKLGTRLNKASFLLDVPSIYNVSCLRFAILHEGKLSSYRVRRIYAGSDVRVCFTKQEKEAMSASDLNAEYIVVEKEKGVFSIWRIKNEATSFFASEKIDAGPSFITKDKGRVSVWVWDYDVYRYREIYDDQIEALSVSGRFVRFREGKAPFHAVITEFNPETKKVEQIYDGVVTSLDFYTGEYTV
ncbi:MAG: hypothetical protein E7019_04635 [Alphaproteobacteria bacterium]|nr:hypothetical protein [Alphaproteobacteria bacterium]